MSQEADDILKQRSHLNRHLYQQKITDAAEALGEQTLPTAYTGFDAESGLARLQDSNGSVFYGDAQTNGAIATGENIRLRRGGVFAKYDAMPRRKPEVNIETMVKNTYRVKTLFCIYNLDGLHLDVYIGGDRLTPKKIFSLDKTGLISPGNIMLGGITNLGKKETIIIETETATSQNYILRQNNSNKQITFEKTSIWTGRVYLRNGTFEASFGLTDGEQKLIYDSNQIIILPFTITSSYQNDCLGRQLVTSNFNQTVKFWTPDRLITDYIYTREFISSRANPGSVIDSGTTYSQFNEHSEGYFLVQKTSDGYITQDFASDGAFVERDESGYYSDLTVYTRVSLHGTIKETKNVLTYFRTNQKPLILNNSDFFIINPSQSEQPLITKNSTVVTFTVIVAVEALIPNPALYYERSYLDPSNISGNVLFNWLVDGVFGLIRGQVYNVSVIRGIEGIETTPITLSITIEISSIIPNISTDFPGLIVSDNGSFYSYYFRKVLVGSFSAMINKSVIPAINLQQTLSSYLSADIDSDGSGLRAIRNYIPDYLKTDNFVSNKIYSVIDTSKKKATIQQWDISDKGDITFNKIFTVDYFQPKGIEQSFEILGHSCY
ncbi:MAG: hypothetical protein HWQ38_37910 [Nostoc sp. NMS7]|uniref:hypothetical protein n=1 Tax=Nostoc sp. NMS7 TaxID=2815391 RepID=UPI0025E2D9BF|nr:hypothetical protein [Nostoc sp. NMS7]MBN3951934.1 hypothetical protein [Nostoc sp. NMS7]